MSEDILLDLGEYGEIVVESQFSPPGVMPSSAFGDYLRDSLANVLADSLVGFGKAMAEKFPREEDAAYALDTFTLEFNLGVGAKAGADGGVSGIVAKIMADGNFKCIYTWAKQ